MFKISQTDWENARERNAKQQDTSKNQQDMIFALCKKARLDFEECQKDCVGKTATIIV